MLGALSLLAAPFTFGGSLALGVGAGVAGGAGARSARKYRAKAEQEMNLVNKKSEELTNRVRDIKTVNNNNNLSATQFLGNSKVYN